MESLCVMGWGLAPAENSSAAAVAAVVVAVVALPDGALYILYMRTGAVEGPYYNSLLRL